MSDDTVALLVLVARYAILYAYGFAYGYLLGRNFRIAAYAPVLLFAVYAWAPVLADSSSFYASLSTIPDPVWLFAVALLILGATWGVVTYIGFQLGKKRRLNPPKPEEAPAPAPLAGIGRDS